MKDISEVKDIELDEYTTAADMAEATITEEQHIQNKVSQAMNDLMGTMHQFASIGRSSYLAHFMGNSDPAIISKVEENMKKLGYNVSREEENDAVLITISWGEENDG